ncbi:MAG: hypothetical protein FJX52_16140 [Alphaproteobacteria bacterium]|nr:hypothetical protein [Alphaproteobacteria bacterium]
MAPIFARGSAPTAFTVARCTRHANFHLHLGAPWVDLEPRGDALQITTPKGRAAADFIILGTGFEMVLDQRPELGAIAAEAALWADRYQPPPGQESAMLASYPYLDDGFAFVPKPGSQASWLRHVHCYNFAATVSHGVNAGGNSSMNHGVPRLVQAITRDFLRADLAFHAERIAHDQLTELDGTEYHGSELPGAGDATAI